MCDAASLCCDPRRHPTDAGLSTSTLDPSCRSDFVIQLNSRVRDVWCASCVVVCFLVVLVCVNVPWAWRGSPVCSVSCYTRLAGLLTSPSLFVSFSVFAFVDDVALRVTKTASPQSRSRAHGSGSAYKLQRCVRRRVARHNRTELYLQTHTAHGGASVCRAVSTIRSPRVCRRLAPRSSIEVVAR